MMSFINYDTQKYPDRNNHAEQYWDGFTFLSNGNSLRDIGDGFTFLSNGNSLLIPG